MDTKTRKTVTVDGKALRYSIDGRPVICAILAEMEATDREVFLGDPGMVAIGQRVGYQSTGMEQAVTTFDQPENRTLAARLREANAYLDRTCVAFDHDVAAATGMLLNAARAAAKPEALTSAQKPWQANAKEGLLISSEGIGAFYSAAARIDLEIQVDPSGKTEKASAAEWLRRIQVRQFGTAEVQAHNAATAIAETDEGIDEATVNATFSTLLEESADTSSLPATTRRAIARIGSGNGRVDAGAPASA